MSNPVKLSSKLRGVDGPRIAWWCPGCDMAHSVPVPPCAGHWSYNDNAESPTLSPSVLVTWTEKGAPKVCHCFITDGNIAFLSDCTHQLAGQTIRIPDWPVEHEWVH